MSRLRLELTTCTPGSHSKLQQSRHLASSIIAMPSVMFKDIGKACSGALAHASEAVRLKAKSCSVVARVRALLRRSAQQGLQDWQVDGRAEDEDARGARTRRRHQARWPEHLRDGRRERAALRRGAAAPLQASGGGTLRISAGAPDATALSALRDQGPAAARARPG